MTHEGHDQRHKGRATGLATPWRSDAGNQRIDVFKEAGIDIILLCGVKFLGGVVTDPLSPETHLAGRKVELAPAS